MEGRSLRGKCKQVIRYVNGLRDIIVANIWTRTARGIIRSNKMSFRKPSKRNGFPFLSFWFGYFNFSIRAEKDLENFIPKVEVKRENTNLGCCSSSFSPSLNLADINKNKRKEMPHNEKIKLPKSNVTLSIKT